MTKKILIVTDAWFPQVHGVVTVLENTMKGLTEKGFLVKVVHPGLFLGIPIFPKDHIRFFIPTEVFRLKKIVLDFDPDHIHILTEGSLGLTARTLCEIHNLDFTTSYHTNFFQYAESRIGTILYSTILRYLRWFHKAAKRTMVSTV